MKCIIRNASQKDWDRPNQQDHMGQSRSFKQRSFEISELFFQIDHPTEPNT
jgi:hypothetical protein